MVAGPPECRSQIVDLPIEPLIGCELARAKPVFEVGIGIIGKTLCVTGTDRLALSDRSELFFGKLADGFQQAIAKSVS